MALKVKQLKGLVSRNTQLKSVRHVIVAATAERL